MATPRSLSVRPEDLCRDAAGQTFYVWPAETPVDPEERDLTPLLTLEGEVRQVPTRRLSWASVSVEVVAEVLAPALAAALSQVARALAPLDPAFSVLDAAADSVSAASGAPGPSDRLPEGGPSFDLPLEEVTARLLSVAAQSPDRFLQALAALESPLAQLARLGRFGQLPQHLLSLLGAGPTRGPEGHRSPASGDPRTVAERVGERVRAELEAMAAARPPIAESFRFDALIQPPPQKS